MEHTLRRPTPQYLLVDGDIITMERLHTWNVSFGLEANFKDAYEVDVFRDEGDIVPRTCQIVRVSGIEMEMLIRRIRAVLEPWGPGNVIDLGFSGFMYLIEGEICAASRIKEYETVFDEACTDEEKQVYSPDHWG